VERAPPGRGRGRGWRLRVQYTRHDRGHAGAVPYIMMAHATKRANLGAGVGGVSACSTPGTTVGTPEPCPTS